jgi:hypothetical protein
MNEFLLHELLGRLFWPTLMILGGVGFAVARFVILSLNKASTAGLIRSIKKNPSLAKEVSESLDIIYAQRKDFNAHHYDLLKEYLRTISFAGDYRIMFVSAYEPNHHLIFTELSYADFGVNVIGRPTDMKQKAFHNFVLKFDTENDTLTALSDVYSDITGKFQKEGFVNAIFQSVV